MYYGNACHSKAAVRSTPCTCIQRCTHQQLRTSDTSQEYKHTIEIVLLNHVVERQASDLDRKVHNTLLT